ncbi:MAG: hypothetical protein WD052_06040 [Bacteroidales bacterium]
MKISQYTALLAFILLGITLGIVVLKEPGSAGKTELSDLLPDDTDDVTEILMITDIDSFAFERQDTVWVMNGEPLNQEAVENLLYAVTRLSMKAIIPRESLEETGPVAEILFLGKRKVLGHFMMAGTSSGDIIYAPGEAHVFGVELRGFENIPLEKVFASNPDHYRKHLLVNLLPSEIKSVEIYPGDGEPFMAKQDSKSNISVKSLSTGLDLGTHIDEHKIRMLFSYFNAIRYNRVITGDSIEAGTLQEKPDAIIKITSFKDESWKLAIYPWTKPGQLSPDLFESLVIFNDGPYLLSVNYIYLDLLMRRLDRYEDPGT